MDVPRIGIDVGGVIIDRFNDHSDTSFFSDNFLQSRAVPEAFDAIASIARLFGTDHVFIVSKCGAQIEEKTRAWFAHHFFYSRTGVHETHVRFCRRRADKSPICRELGINYFVDDRLEVLEPMLAFARHLYAFDPTDAAFFSHVMADDRVHVVRSWWEINLSVMTQLRRNS